MSGLGDAMTEDTTTNTYCDGPSGNHNGPVDGYYAGPFRDAKKFDGWIERDGKHYCPECAKEMTP